MKNFEKIACIADIHVRKIPTRNNEYETVFNRLIESLEKNKPSVIVISGDLVHEYLNLQPEQLILINGLLNNLANIAPVRIIFFISAGIILPPDKNLPLAGNR
jgi:DNA repair exonuclease SbcCD nuclease subunit